MSHQTVGWCMQTTKPLKKTSMIAVATYVVARPSIHVLLATAAPVFITVCYPVFLTQTNPSTHNSADFLAVYQLAMHICRV